MKTLSAKQLEMNQCIINKIEFHPKNIFTTNELVALGLFTSNGWAHMRRRDNLPPKYTQFGPRVVTYKKEDVLEWIHYEIKDKSYLLQLWNKTASIFEEKTPEISPYLIDTIKNESESKSQWIRDRIIETLVTNRSPELDKALNNAFRILKGGPDGQEREANQNTCNC